MATKAKGRNRAASPPDTPAPAAASRTVTAGEATRAFGDLLSQVGYGGQRVVITRHGRPIAELIPARDEAPAPAATTQAA